MDSPYCGTCGEYNVPIRDGVCTGCGTDYFDEIDSAKRLLVTVRQCKANGWKTYPKSDFMGRVVDIDKVIEKLEKKIASNG